MMQDLSRHNSLISLVLDLSIPGLIAFRYSIHSIFNKSIAMANRTIILTILVLILIGGSYFIGRADYSLRWILESRDQALNLKESHLSANAVLKLGDCGDCQVLVAKLPESRWNYRYIEIVFIFKQKMMSSRQRFILKGVEKNGKELWKPFELESSDFYNSNIVMKLLDFGNKEPFDKLELVEPLIDIE
jgi:hypothetical protein